MLMPVIPKASAIDWHSEGVSCAANHAESLMVKGSPRPAHTAAQPWPQVVALWHQRTPPTTRQFAVEQVPLPHAAPPGHTVPQRPQLVVLVLVFTSQPLVDTPSQSPKPVLHEATRQAPATQAAMPLLIAQAAPQAPQFDGSLPMLSSQPLAGLRSQSAKPALQVKPQVPAAQLAVALARGGQTVPHAPQLFGSVLRLVQLPEQLVSPDAQVTTQAPAEHTWPPVHAVVQVPQRRLSTWRSRHTPEQLVCPEGHTRVQAPPTQD